MRKIGLVIFIVVMFVAFCWWLLSCNAHAQVTDAYIGVWDACPNLNVHYNLDSLFNVIHPNQIEWFGGSIQSSYPWVSFYAGSVDSMNFETGHNYCGNDNYKFQQVFQKYHALYGTVEIISILCNNHSIDALVEDTSAGGKCDQLIMNWCDFAVRHGCGGIDVDNEYFKNGDQVYWEVFFKRVRQRYPNFVITIAGPTWAEWTYGNASTGEISRGSFQYINYVHVMGYNQMPSNEAGMNSPLYHNPALSGDDWWDNRSWHEWLAIGARKSQIIMGLSGEGHVAVCSSPASIGQRSTNNSQGQSLRYFNFPSSAFDASNIRFDSYAQTSYSVVGDSLFDIETPQSVARKVKYVQDSSLAGIFVYDPWSWQRPGIQDHNMLALAQAIVGVVPPPPPPPAPVTVTVTPSSVTDSTGKQMSFLSSITGSIDSIASFRSAKGSPGVWVTSHIGVTGMTAWTWFWTPVQTGVFTSYAVAYRSGISYISNSSDVAIYAPNSPPPPCYTKAQLDSAYTAGISANKPQDTTGSAQLFWGAGLQYGLAHADTLNPIRRALSLVPNTITVNVPKPTF